MSLAFACFHKFKVYETDVNSTWLNGNLEEQVYIGKLEGLLIINNKDCGCKIKKYLYGLKQDPRA